MLLRGVNVGGAHRLPMAELRALLLDAGHGEIATYLQSGNVSLRTDLEASALAADVSARIEARFGFPVPVTVRTGEALDAVLTRDPLPGAAADPKRYVVTFLDEPADPAALAFLHGLLADGERLDAHGRELYSHHPRGQARSKLAAALTAPALGPTATARNWSTVRALAELTAP